MNTTTGIDDNERTAIMRVYTSLDRVTLFALLGVEANADVDTIRRRFGERSRTWHPDGPRWQGRELGPFRPMLEAIHARLVQAAAILTDPKRRAEYERRQLQQPAGSRPEPAAPDSKEKTRERRRRPRASTPAAGAEARWGPHTPRPGGFHGAWGPNTPRPSTGSGRRPTASAPSFSSMSNRSASNSDDLESASEAVARADVLEKTGDLYGAQQELRRARAFAPSRADIAERSRAVDERVESVLVDPLLARGRRALKSGNHREALHQLQQALKIDKAHAVALKLSALCMVELGIDSEESVRRARKATLSLNDDAEAHYVLALAFRADGKRKAARSSCERALELEPDHAGATKLLRRLRFWL